MSQRYLGIWMDHTSAHLTKLTADSVETITVESAYTSRQVEHTLPKSEKNLHYKEANLQLAFYKKLSEAMLEYDEVLLFGPSDAKSQLLNNLRVDHRFDNIKIQVKNAIKMTEPQEHAFIRSHFLSKYFHITYYKIKTNETCNEKPPFRTWRQSSKCELYN